MSETVPHSPDWQQAIEDGRRNPRPRASRISLVIPTLGRPVIAECLQAVILGSTWPAAVIVVDQGASAQIGRWLADLNKLGIDTRHEPRDGTGRALGLNHGLRLVRTPFVVVTDDDCIPDANWIEGFASWFRDNPETVVTGRVLAGGDERVLNVVTEATASLARRPGLVFDRLSGGNCGIPMEALDRVGLFDDDPCMRFSEDGEWAYRALRAGVPIAFRPELVVTHLGWRDRQQRLDQYRGYARSHAAFLGKHLRRGDFFILARSGVHLARALRRWLRGVLTGDAELAANGRSYAGQFIPGIIAGMRSPTRPPTLT